MGRRGQNMARQISMATRKELIAALGARYRASSRSERGPILDELVRLAGYHRKHAVRVLNRDSAPRRDRRARDRLYDEMVRQALIVTRRSSSVFVCSSPCSIR